jgi:hypothetical protein
VLKGDVGDSVEMNDESSLSALKEALREEIADGSRGSQSQIYQWKV